MKTELRGYQREGVRLIEWFDGRALLADDMGLGKTVQSLAWREKFYGLRRPTVVICPADVKYVWENQCAEHLGLRAEVLSHRTPYPLTFGDGKVRKDALYVINYDILGDPRLKSVKTWVTELVNMKPGLVIVDEVHAIKDRSTIRYKAVKHLCQRVPYVIGISGTPATNCPAELWPFLNICRPDVFKSFWEFGHKFCGPRRTPWGSGWEFKGATRTRTLNRLLTSTCMIRRRKEDVLKDLPAKTRTVVPVDIEKRKDYEKAEKDLIRWLVAHKKKSRAARAAGNEKLLRVGYLRRYAAELKMTAAVRWIEDFLKSGNKLLVFGVHHAGVLDKLSEHFRGRCVRVDGKTPTRKRELARLAFHKDPSIRLFIGNIDAAGTGWSCTATSDVLLVEMPWVPGKMTQAEDRCHGLGRGVAGRGVNVYVIVAHGTIEERLVKILQKKQSALGRVLDGKKTADFDILSQLEEALTGRK